MPCSGYGQSLPGKIRGYKVHDTKVSINASADDTSQTNSIGASVKLDEPVIADAGLSGVTIELGARFTVLAQTGQIDFLTFHDFQINGVPIEIEEYDYSFSFKKGKEVSLPKPVRLNLRISSLTKAVYKELLADDDDLPVTGTIFVFGKFKKMGIRFKRVIPITIDMTIRNPLHS